MSSFEFYQTDENGIMRRVDNRVALNEISAAQMADEDIVTEMTYSNGNATITYADGRTIKIRRIRKTKGSIVTVKGKHYVVGNVQPEGRTGETTYTPQDHVNYWTWKDGRPLGATRIASSEDNPGTVGAAIWAEVIKLIA
jgi:hypothetical protein